MEFAEEIREFLIESSEGLASLDREIVQLEQTPDNFELISSAFRTIHTIKGTCGFFGYDILGSVTHITENILSQVRERQRPLTPELISLILEAIDHVKLLLASIEATGAEGEDRTLSVRARLEQAHRACKPQPDLSAEGAVRSSSPAPSLGPTIESGGGGRPGPQLLLDAAESSMHVANFIAPQTSNQPPLEQDPTLSTASVSPGQGDIVSSPETSASSTVEGQAQDTGKESVRDIQLAETTIRVDVALLDKLMNLVGELVLARNQLLQSSSADNPAMQQTSQRLNLITSELQEGVMKTRMQPIGVVWNKLPRVVRDLASKCGKRVQIQMEGAGTELDKTIIEAIKDPLTHIVRNSCDHGIETPEIRLAKGKPAEGTLLLRAFHEGGVVNIEISDDGAGIDTERVKAKCIEKGLIRPEQAASISVRDALHLIFLPGFSTAAQITSISGRGVGMDVVKTNIEKIGGSVEVIQRPEAGTTIRIKIPLTLAIIPGLVVTLNCVEHTLEEQARQSREERFIIPQANLLELVRIEGKEIAKRVENVHGTPIFHHRGKLLPLVYLSRVLRRGIPEVSPQAISIVVLQAENRQIGLVVDHIGDTQEIVVKPLGRQLKGLSCYVGATIMGDGRLALILDVAGLARLSGLQAQGRLTTPDSVTTAILHSASPQMLLLVRAGSYERLAVPLSLVDRLEEVSTSSIERAGGRLVLYYRGDILPLVSMAHLLESGEQVGSQAAVQIVVFSDGNRRVGLIVDAILDIVNEAIHAPRSSQTPGLLGAAVIGGKITDLIDLHAVVEFSGQNWLKTSGPVPSRRYTILLMDQAPVAREMIADFLTVSGYHVLQASTPSDALAKLSQTLVDGLVLASVGVSDHLPHDQAFLSLFEDGQRRSVPVVTLFDHEREHTNQNTFAAQVARSDRSQLLRVLAALLQSPRPLTKVVQ